jgi:hypothetical protein
MLAHVVAELGGHVQLGESLLGLRAFHRVVAAWRDLVDLDDLEAAQAGED